MNDQSAESAPEAMSVLVFRSGGKTCALPLGAVHEIIPVPELAQPPGLPALLLGFANLSGTLVPVLHLSSLLGLPGRELELFTPLVVVQMPSGKMALLVDEVLAVRKSEEALPLPRDSADSFNGCTQGLLRIDGRDVPVLNVDRLLLEQERARVEEFRGAQQLRLAALAEAAA